MDELRDANTSLPDLVLLGLAVIELEEDDGVGQLACDVERLVYGADGIINPCKLLLLFLRERKMKTENENIKIQHVQQMNIQYQQCIYSQMEPRSSFAVL